ncbi:MAG: type II toxin-antitoxin system RelE family toxin [Thermoplasmatota archaeon]
MDRIQYQLLISKKFSKGLKDKIRSGKPEMRERVKRIFYELKEEPHIRRSGLDIKLISSKEESIYRVRIGEYRIIYEIDEKEKTIMITKIFQREKGY